ncbi:hypothetical protein EDC01DRAFT_615490 [Geopyxis carbonaria]|nr:hypothetical protein EDC01DRAFT_615490 [Geopyxis carbonaria]
MRNLIGDSESLTLYKPDKQDFENRHWSECFGDDNIYFSYFDNFTSQTYRNIGFKNLEKLKNVDRDIFNGLSDPVWMIYNDQSLGKGIFLKRHDVSTFRKYLYLMTALGARDRRNHLMAKGAEMNDARTRRQTFVKLNGLEHVRDIWLHNTDQIISTPHHLVPNSSAIFDLDCEDYRANARERYPVFWQAPPGYEFVLTDSAFGGFEGGQIGAKGNDTINMSAREFEKHVYTQDTMWHQIYILSPTLAVALCHPTLMHSELYRLQRKRWGLRRSLLEDLPHDLPAKYFKDMTKKDMSFSKNFSELPAEVEKAFAGPEGKAYEKRKDDEIVFQIHSLKPDQVALVNTVLLHNQQLGPKIKNVCVRPASSYNSFYLSLIQFQRNPWPKYSKEEQNDYQGLIKKLLELDMTPISPGAMSPTYQFQQLHQIPQAYDSRQQFNNVSYALQAAPRYEEYLDASGRPQLRAHSASTQSSLTSSFTPSSQSSYSYSSASSQSSASTKTTSIDTPRFESKQFHQQRTKSPTRKEHAQKAYRDEGVRLNGSSHRGSDSSGKTQKSKATEKSSRSDPQNFNIVIEQSMQNGTGSQSSGGVPIFRGRNPDPVQYYGHSHSNPGSKKSSPNPGRAELQRQQLPEPPVVRAQHMPPPAAVRTAPIEQYLMDPVPPPPQIQRRANRSPERQNIHDLQPPQRSNRSPERPAVPQRSQTLRDPRSIITAQDRQSAKYDQGQTFPLPRSANRSPERGIHLNARGRCEPLPVQPQRIENSSHERGRPQDGLRLEQTVKAQRNPGASHERTSQIVDSVSERLRQVVNSDLPPPPQLQPRHINRSPDRKPEPQRVVSASHDKPRTINGHTYQSLSSTQPQQPKANPNITSQSQPQVQQKAPVQKAATQSQPPPQPQVQAQAQQHANSQQNGVSSRNTSASNEHAVRPGVEFVLGRREPPATAPAPQTQPQQHQQQSSAPAKIPPPPVVVEKVVAQPPKIAAPVAQKGSATAENPVVKQLRFETPPRSVSHKLSDMSLAGSMVAHAGDSPGQLLKFHSPEDDSESDSESESQNESEGEDWEDEGYAEDEQEQAQAQKPSVRFADKPMLKSPARTPAVDKSAALVRRAGAVEIERPSSRLGRRVEIPRPLSRNTHARFERFESRKAKLPQPITNRRF